MRSYIKVYGPIDQSFISSTPQEGADKAYELIRPRKASSIDFYNFLAGVDYGAPAVRPFMIWYLIDTQTGTPPGGGTILASFSVEQMATGIFSLRPYSLHPTN